MLTIAGTGVSLYSLKDLSLNIEFGKFDCIVADTNFDNIENRQLIPSNINCNFLSFQDIKLCIKENLLNNKNILYIITGSPLFYSATSIIISYLKDLNINTDDIKIVDAESSKTYLLKTLKISENNVISMSLHGKNILSLDLKLFLSSKYTFLICDADSLHNIYKYTKYLQNNLIFYLGSKMGSKYEKIEKINLQNIVKSFSKEQIKELFCPYVLLIEKNDNFKSINSANENFLTNKGMLTKAEKRILTLQALQLDENSILWDIGAGSGAISIDAYKLFRTRTILFEKNQEQCNFIKQNLASHNVAAATLYEGNVLSNYQQALLPDRIFIGGGGSEILSQINKFIDKLNDNGLLVANIVILEHLSLAIETIQRFNYTYTLKTIDLSEYKNISSSTNMNISSPERTLFQLIIRK